MPRKPNRWSYKTGERGRNRVRVFENRLGVLYVEFYEQTASGVKPRRTSLGHKDRERAKRQADQIAARFAAGDRTEVADPTLGTLFDNYMDEVTPTKRPCTQKHDRQASRLVLQCWGRHRKLSSLSARDWHRYVELRRSGALGAGAVRAGTVESDLKWVLAVFNWAVRAKLVGQNPLKGLPLPREKNPNRQVFTAEEYEVLRSVAPTIDKRFALAVVLAHETGHRLGAIRQLRWSDIDFEDETITWRADADKTGREHVTPLTSVAEAALRTARATDSLIGDTWVFRGIRDVDRPLGATTFHKWMREALDAMGLRGRRGMGYHSLRRKFATELRDIPLKDLMDLGGWRDHRTILQCYQHPDMDSMRNALEGRSESTHQSTHREHAASGH